MGKDFVNSFYHKDLAKEIKRVLVECRGNGLYINKKQATAVVSEKSRKGTMTVSEIKDYLNRLDKVYG